jgi:ABC-type lipoprotein release transport system permease subunit
MVGVAGDTKYNDLRDENCRCEVTGGSMAPVAFVPMAQNPSPFPWAPVIVRSADVTAVTASIARRIEQLNPAIALHFIELKAQLRERLVVEQMIAWLAGAFGLLAMVLVAVGLYGIIAYLAASRRNEIGIRLSLGATRGQIIALMLRDNAWTLAAGLVIGLPVALAAMRGAGSLLFGLTTTDVPTVAGATVVLAIAAALAGSIPAWRAARIRLDDALRCD